MSKDQRSVLLTHNTKTPSSNRLLQESTEINVNYQSKKLEAYKAKWKASIQEKQQLQEDHQRLLKRLRELERKDLAKTQQNRRSKDSEEKRLNYSSNRVRSSVGSSRRVELQKLEGVQLSAHVDFSSRRNSIGVTRSTHTSIGERFRDSSSPTTGFLESSKPLEIAKHSKSATSNEDEKSLQFHSSSKSLNTDTGKRLNETQFVIEEGAGETSQTLKVVALTKELSVLSNRKKKLEQEVFQLKTELSKEEGKRWIVIREHIEAQRKLCNVMNNWKLFYDSLVQSFLPECQKFLSCIKGKEAISSCLQGIECEISNTTNNTNVKRTNNLGENAQEGQLNRFSIDTRISSDGSIAYNDYAIDSTSSFHNSGEQLDALLESEGKSLFEDDVFVYSAEWSTVLNDFVCNQPFGRVICHKLLTNLKNLDSVERKFETVTQKLEDRIKRLRAKISILCGNNPVQVACMDLGISSDCTLAINSFSSGPTVSLEEGFEKISCQSDASQRKNSASKCIGFQNSKTLTDMGFLEPLQRKVEELETKYCCMITRILVQNDKLSSLRNNQSELKSTHSLCFLSLVEELLRLLELSSKKHNSVLLQSFPTNRGTDSQNGLCREFSEDFAFSKLGQTFCIHCQSLLQENKALKERIVELEEENSSLADQIF
ncbi:hypothetical protein GpartN1_g1368.t1 [Galdieria partita]|uniref:Uncharacterized protein n=1 Tax=Galdieria partita TaxID=83374 RepID=A0A9C7UNP2_9RHOD|nr:hypothetical protein GpartN1_g1368.t1 [Galdieria partita]